MNHITSDELSHWLTLTQAPLLGIRHIKKLLSHFDSVKNIGLATSAELKAAKLNDAQIHAIKHPNKIDIERTLQWCENKYHHLISFNHAHYPLQLAEITSPPVLLYIQGDFSVLSDPQIAMVGSRNPSHTGLELSAEFAGALSQSGLVITSGLALGIDTASHHGALNASGKTIAVLGSGLQCIYPKKNAALAEKIIAQGCLISEFPLHAPPSPQHFPQRNRIISGLSFGTLVVEAAIKSGSLITAHFALEQGRDVFAIPGSIRNPMATGCLALIQQGAKCVTCVEDILEEINYPRPFFRSENSIHATPFCPSSLDCTDQQVLACIDDVTTIDQICARSKLSAQLVMTTLLKLELNSVVKKQWCGYIKLGAMHDRK